MEYITPFLPLIGVIIGGIITGVVTSNVQKKAFERQRVWDKEKLEEQFNREQLMKKLEVYTKLLRVNGEVKITDFDMYTGEWSFNHEPYELKVKPILFESFHLLSPKIAECTQEIENLLSKWDAMEEADEGEADYACSQYKKIVSEIKNELDLFRKRHEIK